MQSYIRQAIDNHQLPPDFINTVDNWYKPIANDIALLTKAQTSPYILGVQGTQGSGKSTLADFLRLLLEHEHNLTTVSLSIDDFYLTLAERKTLADTVHPLLMTRGVPGTHDVTLANDIITQLQQLDAKTTLAIPRFNKAIDDRYAKEEWDNVQGPINVIILEGWCIGIPPQTEEDLTTSINTLEETEDTDGAWRHFVNNKLAEEYLTLFSLLQGLVVLTAPSFQCVYEWRLLQEQKLKEKWQSAHGGEPTKIQTPEQIQRFISHYQRLTEHGLKHLPHVADWQLILGKDHAITQLNKRQKNDNG